MRNKLDRPANSVISIAYCSNVTFYTGDNPYIEALPRILGVKKIGSKLKEFMEKARMCFCFLCTPFAVMFYFDKRLGTL